MQPIITSPLDTDAYKFFMQQFAANQWGMDTVRYRFANRNDFDYRPYQAAIREQVEAMADLRFNQDDLAYLRSLGYFREDYLDWLSRYRFEPTQVRFLGTDAFNLEIVGPWEETILWEVPLLAIMQEVVSGNRMEGRTQGLQRLAAKIGRARPYTLPPNVSIIEFGTRRRYSAEYQRQVVARYSRRQDLVLDGTSNVALAREFGLPCVGTMAHEFFQMAQSQPVPLEQTLRLALDEWMLFYRGQLGIALTDILPSAVFNRELDALHAKAYDGYRQDSGNPHEWAVALKDRLRELGVDPATKTVVFSDGLDLEKGCALGRIASQDWKKVVLGIGTKLTCDIGDGYTAKQNVIKLVEVAGRPVAKVSDTPGKGMCESPEYLERLRKAFNF